MSTPTMTFSYATPGGPPVARDPRRFPATQVWAEVKPHTARGIRDGVAQLRGRGNHGTRARHLVTYRPSRADPAWYDVLISDPDQLRVALAGWGTGVLSTWRVIGRFRGPRPDETIPLRACGAELGRRVEPLVRAAYASWVGISLPSVSPSRPGVDIAHELAGFLRELAAELETQ